MALALLQQSSGGGVPPGVIVGVILITATNIIVLAVSLRLARRMRAIGDARSDAETHEETAD